MSRIELDSCILVRLYVCQHHYEVDALYRSASLRLFMSFSNPCGSDGMVACMIVFVAWGWILSYVTFVVYLGSWSLFVRR